MGYLQSALTETTTRIKLAALIKTTTNNKTKLNAPDTQHQILCIN